MEKHITDTDLALVVAGINRDLSPKDRRIIIFRALRALHSARILLSKPANTNGAKS